MLSVFNQEQLNRLETKVDRCISLLYLLLRKEQTMAGELDALKVAVQKETDVTTSAVTLLKGLKDKLDAAIAANDMSQVVAVSQQIGSNTDALAAAVAANTPAATP